MAEESDAGQQSDFLGFVVWVDRSDRPGADTLRGVIECSATSDRRDFDSGRMLLEILASGSSCTPAHEISTPRSSAGPHEKEKK